MQFLVNALENAGVYKDQSVFGTVFSVYGRPLVPEDHADVRRYVLTILLAVELCSVNAVRRMSWSGRTWDIVGQPALPCAHTILSVSS